MNADVPYSGECFAQVNGITVCYDTFGERSSPALLLLDGNGCQMTLWHEDFCAQLARRGYWVIRHDNRDVGLSTHFDAAGVPDVEAMRAVVARGEAVHAPYTFLDMANDAVGLLDHLGIESAHLLGISMGGMLAQVMAIHYPHRVRTMTSLESSTSDPSLPRAAPSLMAVRNRQAPDREGRIRNQMEWDQLVIGQAYQWNEDELRRVVERGYDRSYSPDASARHSAAGLVSGSRKEALRQLRIPTLVIHGAADPLLPLAHGIDTANTIPGARLLVIEGLGHGYLPPAAWPPVLDAIAQHAR